MIQIGAATAGARIRLRTIPVSIDAVYLMILMGISLDKV